MIIVIGRVDCRPERRDDLVALMKTMQEASLREEGCLRYGFYAAVENPLTMIAVEEWADRDALDRHFATAHLHKFAAGLRDLAATAPEVAIHEVADTRPFPGDDG